jgi:hypothetical protein
LIVFSLLITILITCIEMTIKYKFNLQMTNQLQPEFYNKLWIHQAPQSVDFSNSFRRDYTSCYSKEKKEDLICDAIKYYSYDLIDHIVNPSEKVIIAAITRCHYYFQKIENPTPNMIAEYLSFRVYADDYNKYKFQLTDKHLNYILSKNIQILQHIEQPTEDQYWIALKNSIYAIEYIKQQTIEMCEYATNISNYSYNYNIWCNRETLIKSLQHYNSIVIKNIIENRNFVHYFYFAPGEYHTLENILKVVKHDPEFIQHLSHCSRTDSKVNIPLSQELCNIAFKESIAAIKFIPAEFQTEEMKSDVLEKNIHLFQHIANKDKELCQRAFSNNKLAIMSIPFEYQTLEICENCIETSHRLYLLESCAIITEKLLKHVFTLQHTIPKVQRFNFIVDFNENALLRIISVRPSLIKELSEEKQTDILVRKALELDGYTIQHVKNKTEEYKALAVKSQPLCVKYLKN